MINTIGIITCMQVVSNIQKLYTLGQKLGKMPQLEQKKTLDNLPEKLPDVLLQQGNV